MDLQWRKNVMVRHLPTFDGFPCLKYIRILCVAIYKPILKEVEKILEEAGLDEEEMRRGAAGGPAASGATGESRNRR